jgi:hypothetical protein
MAFSSQSSNLPPPVQLDTRWTNPPDEAWQAINEPPPIQTSDLENPNEEPPSLAQRIFRAPPWLVSLIAHLGLILLLALIPLVKKLPVTLIITGTTGVHDEPVPFELSNMQNDALASVDVAEVPIEAISIPSVLDLPEFEPTPVGVGLTITDIDPDLGFTGRSGALRSTLMAAYGGTPGTEQAVKDGLAWLARQQNSKEGFWSLRGPYGQAAVQENRIAATAMALLAFAGDGNTHRQGTYAKEVERGLAYLRKQQDADGFFAIDAPDQHQMYAQAQATIAICEIYGMSQDKDLKEVVQKALRFAEVSQGREGGWRYQPRDDSDTSVTGWFVMALMSGRMAGLSTDERVLQRVHDFLDSVQSDGGSRYGYTPFSKHIPSFAMTAEGLLCREYLGWHRSDPRLMRGCETLAKAPVSSDFRERAYYYWYYATQTLHHFGGEPWQAWNEVMREALPSMQLSQGKERGSWPPEGDEHSSSGGRLYATCFAIYCLEVYYRHLPLYGFGKQR